MKVYIKDFVQASGLWKRFAWRTIGVKKVLNDFFNSVKKMVLFCIFLLNDIFLTLLKKTIFLSVKFTEGDQAVF